MTGTLQAIARLIHGGDKTLAECSARLGITKGQLEDRLLLMERQGYILRHNGKDHEQPCTCGHCCATCCHSSGNRPVLQTLTPKGERLIRR